MRNVQLLIYCLIFYSCVDDGIVINKEIVSTEKGDLYIITKNWGLTSDKQLTLITTRSNVQKGLTFDTTVSYFYTGLMPFLYRVKNDTLFIYSMTRYKSPKPVNFNSSIVIVQKSTIDSDYLDVRTISDDERNEYKAPLETLPINEKYNVPPPQ